MPIINAKYNINLETSVRENKSPMCQLYNRVVDIFKAYPDEILKYFEGVTIQLTENHIPICGEIFGGAIQISTGFMEKLWCNTFLDVAMSLQYSLLYSQVDCEHGKSVEVKWSQEMFACYEYIVLYANKTEWPGKLPAPIPDYIITQDSSLRDLTTEIFLYELMMIFLHEAKHIDNNRKGKYQDNVLADELDADTFAVNTYMGMELPDAEIINKKINFFNKRMLSMVELGSYYITCSILSPEKDEKHPAPISRIESYISAVSGVLGVKRENDYDYSSDKYDIRPTIGHAANILHMRLQYLVLPFANSMHQRCLDAISSEFESPFNLYFEAKNCLLEYIDYKNKHYESTGVDFFAEMKKADAIDFRCQP